MAAQIEIRPLRRGEETLWVQLGVSESERVERAKKLTKYLEANPTLPPINYQLALRDGALLGKMSGTAEGNSYQIARIFASPGEPLVDIAKSFLDRLSPFEQIEAMTWAKSEDEEWHRTLVELGFNIYIEKPYFRTKLSDLKFSYRDPFEYYPLSEVGEEKFLRYFSLIYDGNLNRNFNNEAPLADFHSHKESAGDRFDPRKWLVAFFRGEPAGVVLPQLYPDTPWDGTIMAVGLATPFRGRGLGKVLHAKGLVKLKELGATDYVGSTDSMNSPMIAVFKANGCNQTGLRRFYRKAT